MEAKAKNIISWVFLGAILAAGIYFFGFRSGSERLITNSENLTHGTETIEEDNNTYQISAHYPIFSGLDEARLEEINYIVKRFIEEEILAYKNEASEGMVDSNSKSVFSADASIVLETPEIISVRYNISSYISGAAHPFNYVKGLNIDVNNAKAMGLADIFDGTYVRRLSELTRTNLLQRRAQSQENPLDQQQEQWIREGTEAREENFSSFVLNADTITIFFNPYQVAPYADGIIEVPIPYRDVQGLIKQDSPVDALLAS